MALRIWPPGKWRATITGDYHVPKGNLTMPIGNLLRRIKRWFARNRDIAEYTSSVGEDGLISPEHEGVEPSEQKSTADEQKPESPESTSPISIRKIDAGDRTQSLEKLQEGFNRLIDRLEGINNHLNRQVTQQDQLIEQLKDSSFRNKQFVEAVERIPQETVKQTQALTEISHQLNAAAESDVAMRQSFNRFNDTLDRLNQATLGQTDSIVQMSKTFAASDRYMKYLVFKQSRRFMWVFWAAVGVCLFAIVLLAIIVLLLLRQ